MGYVQFFPLVLNKVENQMCLMNEAQTERYVQYIKDSSSSVVDSEGCIFVLKIYRQWSHLRRPFYRLYPGVIQSLQSMNLDKLEDARLNLSMPEELSVLSLELPIGMVRVDTLKGPYGMPNILVDFNKRELLIPYLSETGVEPVHHTFEDLHRDELDLSAYILRIVYGVMMIGNNPDLVKQRVLNADQAKYEKTHDQKYVEKAKRRGVVGFDVGSDIPTKEELSEKLEEAKKNGTLEPGFKSPHFRCSYIGLRWTGEGRTIPKMVRIKECLINWDFITKIPTGFMDNK